MYLYSTDDMLVSSEDLGETWRPTAGIAPLLEALESLKACVSSKDSQPSPLGGAFQWHPKGAPVDAYLASFVQSFEDAAAAKTYQSGFFANEYDSCLEDFVLESSGFIAASRGATEKPVLDEVKVVKNPQHDLDMLAVSATINSKSSGTLSTNAYLLPVLLERMVGFYVRVSLFGPEDTAKLRPDSEDEALDLNSSLEFPVLSVRARLKAMESDTTKD